MADGLENPFAAVRAPSGDLYVSGGRSIRRRDASGSWHLVATASEDIGPLALAPDGTAFFTTSTRLFRLPAGGGTPQVIATGLNSAHGVAVEPDGTVLVSDTSNDRVRRIDPRTSRASTLLETGEPRGLDVAPDGTIHLVEARKKRVGRFGPTGARLGGRTPAFGDPYDVAVGAGGATYVVDTAASGRIVRVTAGGKVVDDPDRLSRPRAVRSIAVPESPSCAVRSSSKLGLAVRYAHEVSGRRPPRGGRRPRRVRLPVDGRARLQPVTRTALARATGLRRTTLRDAVRPLIERGHVVESPHPGDGRATLLALTPAGQELFDRGLPVFRRFLDELDDELGGTLAALEVAVRSVRFALERLADCRPERRRLRGDGDDRPARDGVRDRDPAGLLRPRGRRRAAGGVSLHARPVPGHVPRPAVDDPPVRGLRLG